MIDSPKTNPSVASAPESWQSGSPPCVDDPQVIRDVQQYLETLEQGGAPDREALLDRYRTIREELAACLDAVELFQQVVPQLNEQLGSKSEDLPRDAGSRVLGTLGDYRIRREIGRGGMGVVYEAEQISMGRRVALKVLPFAGVLAPKHLQRFQNEARAAGSLDHPNIVHVYSVGSQRGVHYYSMQYVEGQTLSEVIGQLSGNRDSEGVTGRRGEKATTPTPTDAPPHPVTPSPRHPLTPPPHAAETSPLAALSTEVSTRSPEFFRTVATLGMQAADALEHAHAVGVVHRDIKPSNLMVDSSGHLWITDFGLAMTQTETNLTMTGDVLGTLRYMSPEQAQAKHGVLDHRSDVYSLGITLWELLTLRPAFAGDDRQELMRQIVQEDPDPPRRFNAAIPKDLETIILRAVAKEPQARYATAGEMADDLGRFIEDKPIRARRPSLVERARRWARRHRTLLWATAVIFIMAVIALSVSTAMIVRAYNLEAAQRERADGEKARAEANFRLARDAVDSLLDELEQIVEDQWALGKVTRLVEYADELHETLPDEIRSSPRHRARLASMHYHRARCALWWRKHDLVETSLQKAIPVYTKLMAEHPGQYESRLGFCYYYSGEVLRETGREDAAEGSYRICVELLEKAERRPSGSQPQGPDPDEVKSLRERAGNRIAQIEKTNLQETIAKLNEAIRLDPNEPGNYEERADAYKEQNDLDRAIADYTKAVELGPELIGPYIGRHDTYFRRGGINKVIENWDEAVRRNPASNRPYGWRGYCYIEKGDFDSSMADHNQAIELDPNHATYYAFRGYLYWQGGNCEKAIQDYTKAIELNPEHDAAYALRGDAYWEIGNPQKAMADYQAAVRTGPENAFVYCWRALGRARLGDIEGARSDLSKTSEIDVRECIRGEATAFNLNEAAWFLATCPDSRLLRPDRTTELAKQVLKVKPLAGSVWATLGAGQYRTGDFPAALEALEESAKLPSFRRPAALFFLAMTHWQLGHEQEAGHWYEKAVEAMEKMQPYQQKELGRFRDEAAALLGVTEDLSTQRSS